MSRYQRSRRRRGAARQAGDLLTAVGCSAIRAGAAACREVIRWYRAWVTAPVDAWRREVRRLAAAGDRADGVLVHSVASAAPTSLLGHTAVPIIGRSDAAVRRYADVATRAWGNPASIAPPSPRGDESGRAALGGLQRTSHTSGLSMPPLQQTAPTLPQSYAPPPIRAVDLHKTDGPLRRALTALEDTSEPADRTLHLTIRCVRGAETQLAQFVATLGWAVVDGTKFGQSDYVLQVDLQYEHGSQGTVERLADLENEPAVKAIGLLRRYEVELTA